MPTPDSFPNASNGGMEPAQHSDPEMAQDDFMHRAANLAEGMSCLVYLLRADAGDPKLVHCYTDMLDERVKALSQLILSAQSSTS